MRSIKKPKNFIISLARRKDRTDTSFLFISFEQYGLKIKIVNLEIEVLQNVSKQNQSRSKNYHPESTRNQCCLELLQRKSALKHCCLALILLLWKIDFSSALIRAESALFRQFQLMYRAESELKQRWSALIISESEVISVEILWDLNPGTDNRKFLYTLWINFLYSLMQHAIISINIFLVISIAYIVECMIS